MSSSPRGRRIFPPVCESSKFPRSTRTRPRNSCSTARTPTEARARTTRRWRRTLARELGGLALGLEQAGAHIATDRIGFARYLKLWSESREKALAWADATVTGSDRTLATTWATSVARLSPESRRLLDRLAFLAPDPVPDSLLDVAVPGEAPDNDAYEARARPLRLFAHFAP